MMTHKSIDTVLLSVDADMPVGRGAENPRAGGQSDEVYPGLMQGSSASRLQKACKTT